jgi:hypothetical protein
MKTKRPIKWPKHRPTKCTPEVTAKVVKYIENGNFIETACILSGIGKTSFYNWMKRGHTAEENNNYNSPYYHFMNEVTKALAINEGWLVQQLMKSAKEGEIRTIMWMLERKFNDRWGRNNMEIELVDKTSSKEGIEKEVEDYASNIEKATIKRLQRLGITGNSEDTKPDDG